MHQQTTPPTTLDPGPARSSQAPPFKGSTESSKIAEVVPDAPKPAAGKTAFKDILIAVHGIGAQQRNATVRSVANRFATSEAFPKGGFAPQPLGYFYSDPEQAAQVSPLDKFDCDQTTGFTEVFWADVPQKAQREGRTLEEIKAWGRTVVARARTIFRRAQREAEKSCREELEKIVEQHSKSPEVTERSGVDGALKKALADGEKKLRGQYPELAGPDFGLAAEVIDEIVDAIQLLENLSWLAEKTINVTFDLRELLEEYVGDVQIVAEFTTFREDIIRRFFGVMQSIYTEQKLAENGDVNLHIVAHSEGTVVAFVGLLYALSGYDLVEDTDKTKPKRLSNESGQPPGWLKHVRGLMTIGSPIDKHLLLWPHITDHLDLQCGAQIFREKKIRWRNYYDFGDPVGFKLETARKFLDNRGDVAFEFCNCKDCRHDMGFARYIFPGKAHNDYWDDPDVFEHFIRSVVKGLPVALPPPAPAGSWGEFKNLLVAQCKSWSQARQKRRRSWREELSAKPVLPAVAEIPETKLLARYLGVALPYVFCAVLLTSGCYLLYKAVTNFVHPDLDPLQRYISYQVTGALKPSNAAEGWMLFRNSLGLAALVAGTTVAARLPRLALHMKRRAAASWCLGAALYSVLLLKDSREPIGAFLAGPLGNFLTATRLAVVLPEMVTQSPGTIGTLVASVLVALLGLSVTTKTRRWGLAGMIERQQRWFCRGARPLIFIGAVTIGLFVAQQMSTRSGANSPTKATTEHLAGATPGGVQAIPADEQRKLLAVSPPVWPVAVAGVSFLYFWWLATVIFDLAFIWNRYVRGGLALKRLRDWTKLGYGGTEGAFEAHRPPPPPQ